MVVMTGLLHGAEVSEASRGPELAWTFVAALLFAAGGFDGAGANGAGPGHLPVAPAWRLPGEVVLLAPDELSPWPRTGFQRGDFRQHFGLVAVA